MLREQMTLFQPLLDGLISDDLEVKRLDETRRALDRSGWEVKYRRIRVQPPIHPGMLEAIGRRRSFALF